MSKNKVILFGAGYFGKVHANDLNILGVLGGIVDINPERKEIAEKYKVPFWNIDVTKYVVEKPVEAVATDIDEAKKILEEAINDVEEKLYSEDLNAIRLPYARFMAARELYNRFKNEGLEPCPEEILKADGWDIVTNTPSHYPIALLGIVKGIKRIFIEKPPTEELSQLDTLIRLSKEKNTIVGVDYIEMAHPVVLATKEVIGKQEPIYYLNHRSKDLRGVIQRGIGGGEGSRIILEDLVHDLSEILYFRGSLEGAKVIEARVERWRDLGYPYNTDVKAQFKIKFPEAEAEVKGSFADPEVRQYVVRLSADEAIYGNTLTRPHIQPIAAYIQGKDNIETIIEAVREGKILTNEDQQKILEKTKAETLEDLMKKYVPECKYKDGKPVYGWAPLYNMLENWLKAESNKDLICDLEKAFDIQRIAEKVYRVAGAEDAMIVRKGY